MEILFLVFTIFSEDRFVSLEVRNYSEFASNHSMSCEDYIGSAKFRKALPLKGLKKPRVRAACLGASQIQGLENLIKQSNAWKEVALKAHEETVLLTGKIRYNREETGRKSVNSYLGKELVLVNSDGEVALYASETVKERDLKMLDGQKVKLRGVFEDHTPAKDSIEQYPTDGQGAPLKRVGYRVIAIE